MRLEHKQKFVFLRSSFRGFNRSWLYVELILGHSLPNCIDGKLFSHAAIGTCTPWHVVIFQSPPSFKKVSLHRTIFIQEAIVFVFLKRKDFL